MFYGSIKVLIKESTHLDMDSASTIRRENRKSELLDLKLSYGITKNSKIDGLALVQVKTSGLNPISSKNTYGYQFIFDINSQKFTKITAVNTLSSEELR